jgi:hypothetical protein
MLNKVMIIGNRADRNALHRQRHDRRRSSASPPQALHLNDQQQERTGGSAS